jgi:hypothetical protein
MRRTSFLWSVDHLIVITPPTDSEQALVALVYAPLVPLVTLAAALAFFASSFVTKYMLLYINVTKVESGGRLWRMLINRLLFCLIIMQCVWLLMYSSSDRGPQTLHVLDDWLAIAIHQRDRSRTSCLRRHWLQVVPQSVLCREGQSLPRTRIRYLKR